MRYYLPRSNFVKTEFNSPKTEITRVAVVEAFIYNNTYMRMSYSNDWLTAIKHIPAYTLVKAQFDWR